MRREQKLKKRNKASIAEKEGKREGGKEGEEEEGDLVRQVGPRRLLRDILKTRTGWGILPRLKD